MSDPIVVLKFGGSVLRSNEDYPTACHEIYRWIRQGYRVVAVVSAVGDTTNELLALAEQSGPDVNPQTVAVLVATGELQSAAVLGLALDRAGIPNRVLDEVAISLRTCGPSLDAQPQSVCHETILAALEHASVIVVPGFIGRDFRDNTTLLGRGGSDFTALFLADQLQAARCRLIKDVDGLYEFDPRTSGLAPQRFVRLSWDRALQLDESIVQHKAIKAARSQRRSFEVAAMQEECGSVVGDIDSVEMDTSVRQSTKLRVGLLGLGTVGFGVYRALQELSNDFSVVAIGVRDPEKAARIGAQPGLLTTDLRQVVDGECDVVVEAIGGIEVGDYLRRALSLRKHVVTANKSLIADSGNKLHELAAHHQVTLSYSAAVGGCVPMLELLARLAVNEQIVEICGVLNGTANLILDRLAEGVSLDQAVRDAQRLGLAELDPARDLHGIDAAEKLVILGRVAGFEIGVNQVHREPIDEAFAQRLSNGLSSRQVARLFIRNGKVQASVKLRSFPDDHRVPPIKGAGNWLRVATASGKHFQVTGAGAGRWPTTEAVIADLLQLSRARGRLHVAQPQLTVTAPLVPRPANC